MAVCNGVMRVMCMGALFLSLAVPAKAFQVSLFVPRNDTVFWASLVRLTRAAAHDLELDLVVYSAGNQGDTMLSQVKAACIRGTDGLLFMNYEHLGKEILSISEEHKVPAFLYNTGFEDPLMVPRRHYPYWIGSMTPDDVRAGGLLAERLIRAGKRSGVGEVRMLAIEGNPHEKSSADRVKGMKTVVAGRGDVTLYGIANAGKGWSRARGRQVFLSEYRRHPDINTVWAAGDDIALGVLDAIRDLGLDEGAVLTGGIDWSAPAVESIRSGANRLSIGGHMLEGAWSLTLMHDYLRHRDFARESTVFKTRMHAIDSGNVDQVRAFLSDNWDRIDFAAFSKYLNTTLLYRFDLPHLLDTFYPKTNAFEITAEERRWLADHPTVRLGIDDNWPPFEFLGPDGRYDGMVADYVRVLEERLGIRCVYTRGMTWSETLTAMKEKRLDMIAAIGAISQHKEAMRLTSPFLSFPLVVITNEQVDFVEDMEALAGRTVAVVKDYSEHKILAGEYPHIKVLSADTTVDALAAVATGKAYAYVGNLAVANYTIKKERLTHLKVSGTVPRTLAISMGVRRDWPLFAGLVSKAMGSISEAERDTIYQRWITLRYEHGVDYTLLWQFLVGAVGVLAVSIYWNRRLSIVNKALKKEIDVRVLAEEALRREQARVKVMAVTDPLTGLYNRRKFAEAFPLEISRLRRSGRYLAFAIMDIDFFKQYNDHYGHQMGDEALNRVGALLLRRCKRGTDYSFRLGGEEFGLLFLARDPDRALAFMESMREAIAGLAIEHTQSKVSDVLTVSLGLVVSDSPTDIDTMYKTADQALYRAKDSGRNRTEMAAC
ncbi:diguanylate cyclase [Desulfoluna spongiiphila]|uniref:diguanylate cyclase n=1 Tax=Desulfoluna spongiiphila TaxID=419481 RepID=A0A1G5H446_9BACT|nr:diguanylate cyclase [Desulfoluna spongiiphila]SCY58120.1 diguanylate cyclase (GGDEF) domain-containing protein [Desulfoluna spongiiphila]VVS94754.1 nucleotide cyclase [Desulfoluna spongiiphila]